MNGLCNKSKLFPFRVIVQAVCWNNWINWSLNRESVCGWRILLRFWRFEVDWRRQCFRFFLIWTIGETVKIIQAHWWCFSGSIISWEQELEKGITQGWQSRNYICWWRQKSLELPSCLNLGKGWCCSFSFVEGNLEIKNLIYKSVIWFATDAHFVRTAVNEITLIGFSCRMFSEKGLKIFHWWSFYKNIKLLYFWILSNRISWKLPSWRENPLFWWEKIDKLMAFVKLTLSEAEKLLCSQI